MSLILVCYVYSNIADGNHMLSLHESTGVLQLAVYQD